MLSPTAIFILTIYCLNNTEGGSITRLAALAAALATATSRTRAAAPTATAATATATKRLDVGGTVLAFAIVKCDLEFYLVAVPDAAFTI